FNFNILHKQQQTPSKSIKVGGTTLPRSGSRVRIPSPAPIFPPVLTTVCAAIADPAGWAALVQVVRELVSRNEPASSRPQPRPLADGWPGAGAPRRLPRSSRSRRRLDDGDAEGGRPRSRQTLPA